MTRPTCDHGITIPITLRAVRILKDGSPVHFCGACLSEIVGYLPEDEISNKATLTKSQNDVAGDPPYTQD